MSKTGKRSIRLSAAFLSMAATIFATVVAAQQSVPLKPAEPKYTEIKYSADNSSYRWDGDDRIVVLRDNVKFIQGDTTVVADKLDYRERTKTAQASGNLKITDPQTAITGDLCILNFGEKKGTLTGNVRMVAKPTPKEQTPGEKSLKSEWKDEATITCDKIEYYYKQKKALVSGNLRITQKTRVITADSGMYLGKDEKVELSGNVKALDEKEKHSFSAPSVIVSLKSGDEWVEAKKASGTFYVKDEEEEPAAEQPAQDRK